ncbi:MAG: hypothetical protein V1787_02810 [Candidatus Micrarchaeota archaeon]
MAGFIDDSVEAAKHGFSWLQDGPAVKNAMLFLGVMVGFLFVFVGGFMLAFGVSLLSGVASPSAALAFGLGAVLFALVMVVLFALAFGFVTLMIVSRAFELAGLKPFAVSPMLVVRYFLLTMFTGLLAFFGGYDNRLRLLVAAVVVSGILGLVNPAFFVLALLLLIPYVIAVVYCAVRLSMSQFIFFEKGLGIREATRQAWDLTGGIVVRLGARTATTGILVAVLLMVVFFIPTYIISLFASPTGSMAGQGVYMLWQALTNIFQTVCSLFAITYVYLIFRSWRPEVFAAPKPPAPV